MRKSEELSNPTSCLNKARDDERLFVILDRDPAFAGTIRDWVQRRIQLGVNKADDPKILSAIALAEEVEAERARSGL